MQRKAGGAGGVLAEGARAPSTNELAAFYRINPATAAKGINVLVEDAVLEKRRGIGMFVAPGAQEQLRANRRKRFAEQFLDPMLAEARRLGIDADTVGSASPAALRSAKGLILAPRADNHGYAGRRRAFWRRRPPPAQKAG